MTNFAQPVSMPCTEEQYNRDLKDGLQKLGYNLLEGSFDWENEHFIVTNYARNHNQVTTYTEKEITERERYFIDHYNPSLFLAIAGMREGEDVHVGEWMMCIKDTSTGAKSGNIYQVLFMSNLFNEDYPKVNQFGKTFTQNEWWRKATLEELITHFTKKDMCYNQNLFNYIADLTGHNCLVTEMQEIENIVLLGPKEHEFKFGDKVLYTEILGQDDPAIEGYFVAYAGGVLPFIVIDTIEQFEMFRDTGQDTYLTAAESCIPFPSPLKITRSEIAEKFGTDHFEIVD